MARNRRRSYGGRRTRYTKERRRRNVRNAAVGLGVVALGLTAANQGVLSLANTSRAIRELGSTGRFIKTAVMRRVSRRRNLAASTIANHGKRVLAMRRSKAGARRSKLRRIARNWRRG